MGNNRQRKPTTAPQERTHKKAPASAKVLPTSGNQEATTKQSATSLKILRAQIDEAKNKRDQLKRVLEEKDQLDASTMTKEQIDSRFEEYVQSYNVVYGPSVSAQRWLEEEAARRYTLDRWRKEERPKQVAELQRLGEEKQRLEKRFWQVVERKRQPPNDATIEEAKANAMAPAGPQENFDSRGERASVYDEDLRRLARHCQGRIRTEKQLRDEFPALRIWTAIDESDVLRRPDREAFFNVSLTVHKQPARFEFIGKIMGISGARAYDWYKTYLRQTGRARRRASSHPHHS